MPLIFHGVTLIEGTGGLARYARAALTALRRGPLASEVSVWLPEALRGHRGLSRLGEINYYPAPHPRRGFAFNHLFWVNCLALHVRRKFPIAAVFSPIEIHSVIPFRRLLITAHDCYADRFGDPRKSNKVGLGRRLCVSQLKRSRVLAVSRFTTRELGELHGIYPPQVETVLNWLDRDYDRAPTATHLGEVRARLGLPERFWLYVGGFRLNKNLPLLFDAYAAVVASGANPPPLVVAGRIPSSDTPFTGPLHAAIDRHPGLRERLVFPGFIPDADLPALYRLANLAICPSSYEGFGYPVIEAAAVGTPVIAARAASFTELGLPADNLFSPDNPAELTALLARAARESAASLLCAFPAEFIPEAGEARFNAALTQWFAAK